MMDAPSPFSRTLPNFQVSWDSTSIGWLKQCPKLYEYQMLEGWEPRTKGIHLRFGGLYAAALERYAHSRASGHTHDEATLAMVRWAMENSGERGCASDCASSLDPPEPCTCGGISWLPWTPTEPDANIKNRYTLLRSLVWNVEDRLSSPFATLILANGKPAVELSFNFEAFSIEGEAVSLSGHLDEVVEAQGDLFVVDDKTTKNALDANYFQQYSPNNQMSLYSIAGRVILDRPIQGVLVRAAQIGVTFNRYRMNQVPRPRAILDEWLVDTEIWIRQAREYALAGHWPLNDRSCFLCSFKRICSVSPNHREAHLKADFKRRVWNPLDSRGDI